MFAFFCVRMENSRNAPERENSTRPQYVLCGVVFIAVGIVLFLCCAAARLQNVYTNEILRRALSKHLAYG